MVEINLPIAVGGKTWLARIKGVGGKFGLSRDFLTAVERNTSRSGKTGYAKFCVDQPGVYESNDGRRGRRFWIVTDTAVEVETSVALAELGRG